MSGSKHALIDLTAEDDADVHRRRRRRRRTDTAKPAAPSEVIDLISDDDTPPANRASASRRGAASTSWERPAGEITCPICFCETAPDEAASLRACGHSFCSECICHYIKGRVEAGEVMATQLVCPCVEPKVCGVAMAPQDVKRGLGALADGERWERLALQRCVEAEDSLGCCPSAGCEMMFEWDPANRKFQCPLCSKSFCLVCRCEPWHQGMRCEQFQAERGDPEAADAAFASFASHQKLRQCPKCKFWVEKTSGCDAMHVR